MTTNTILHYLNKYYSYKNISPKKEDIFKAFTLCSLKDTKVIMLGQDPYPQKGVATGILFGNKGNILSPSLQIIKEAVIDYEKPHNTIYFDNSLESWAKQGVLMLNSALTVEINKIGSHTKLWEPFISELFIKLSKRETGLIYALFGNQAQSFEKYINPKFNYILKEKHPAYYYRNNIKMSSTIFREIDKLLIGKYGESIEWFKEF